MSKAVPKFAVGDTVRSKQVRRERVFIVETLIQTCPGGTQIIYTGRPYTPNLGFAKDYVRFNEIELEAMPEPSTELIVAREQLAEARAKKMKYIKAQDFETAADWRDKESKLKEEVKAMEEFEGLRD